MFHHTQGGEAMHTTRLASALAIVSILLAACGSGSAATQGPAGETASTGGGGGGSATEMPEATQGAEATNAGGGGGSDDVTAVANQLVPPNSTEISKTTAEDTWFVIYESTDSVDSLKHFYEGAIASAGQKIFSTTTIQGGVSYVFAKDESGGFGGSVNIYPSGDGKVAVQVTVAKT
jgi:hypothetical protein